MTNQWLRLWHDMPTDPKWRTISRISGQRIGDVIAVYTFALVSASENRMKRGVTQCNAEDVATALDIKTGDVEAIFSAMQGRVLDGDWLLGWEKRQPKREDNSSGRVKAHRERNAMKRGVTQCNAPDKDTDKEDIDDDDARAKPSTVQEIFAWCEEKLNSPIAYHSSPVAAWMEWGADFEKDIRPTVERHLKTGKPPPRSLAWLDEGIAKSIKQRSKGMPDVTIPFDKTAAIKAYNDEVDKQLEEMYADAK